MNSKLTLFKRFGILLIFVAIGLSAHSQNNKTRLVDNWEFRKEHVGGIYEIWRDKKHDFSGWTKTTLPHCVNAFDAVDPDQKYYQGETWYKTQVKVNNPFPNGRTLLHFEGAGQKTKVFTYLSQVGYHVGGYDEFTVDMTASFLEFSKNNLFTEQYNQEYPVAICADNSRDVEMMPSDLSDFSVYGGLYRYVNLVYVPAISVERLQIESAVIKKGKSAHIKLHMHTYNPDKYTDTISLRVIIKSHTGKVVYTNSTTLASFNEQQQVFEFDIKNPELWSPNKPNLYHCEFSLVSKHGEHKVYEKFGVRYFEFIENGPFHLNGNRLMLRGTHRHEDHSGVAAAMTEEMMRQEMTLMKQMGVNFIRLGHYQQSRIILNLCDELGILVWEEIPWCRGGLGNETYRAQGKRMLTNMINQHYNHPSIIIWGLGNENDWPGDFETFDKEAIRAYMTELNNLAHQLDTSRKTAIRRCDFCKDIIDVYSPSIWAGWYRGTFTNYKAVSEMEMKEVKHFLHVEWGASNHAGRHSENPDLGLEKITTGLDADERDGDFLMNGGDARASKDGDWTETYACNLIDWHLKEQESMNWLTGTAYWPFKDFSTPVRPENPVPYVNQKGVVERDFTKKEGYYVFQSYWTEKPMVHIYGHTWETRWGEKNQKKIIKVYSNCPEVELIVNGKPISKKRRNSQDYPAAGLRWAVQLNEGPNTILAVGYKGSERINDEIKVNYQTQKWGEPSHFAWQIIADENGIATLKAEIFDSKNVRCLDANNTIRFKIAGDGKLIDNLGTSKASKVVQLYNGHAYISINKQNGESVVSVSAEGIPTQFITIK